MTFAQIGRGSVSLATVFDHAYQESQVSIVTQAGKHVGEVGVFFVYASNEVGSLYDILSCTGNAADLNVAQK